MMHFLVNEEAQLLTCKISGHLEFLDTARELQATVEVTTDRIILDGLFVFQDERSFQSATKLRVLAPLVRVLACNVNRHWAVVVPNLEVLALATYVRRDLQLGVVACKCFTTESEALGWLQAASFSDPTAT